MARRASVSVVFMIRVVIGVVRVAAIVVCFVTLDVVAVRVGAVYVIATVVTAVISSDESQNTRDSKNDEKKDSS